jgi:hypothetical protein
MHIRMRFHRVSDDSVTSEICDTTEPLTHRFLMECLASEDVDRLWVQQVPGPGEFMGMYMPLIMLKGD